MTVRIFLVRPRPGVVGERKRIVHVVRAPENESVPERCTTYCGAEFDVDDVELLDRPRGMPCESCLNLAPLPDDRTVTGG